MCFYIYEKHIMQSNGHVDLAAKFWLWLILKEYILSICKTVSIESSSFPIFSSVVYIVADNIFLYSSSNQQLFWVLY